MADVKRRFGSTFLIRGDHLECCLPAIPMKVGNRRTPAVSPGIFSTRRVLIPRIVLHSDAVKNSHHRVSYHVVMELEMTSAPAGNRQRHDNIIAAWQMAQRPHTLRAYSRTIHQYCAWLDANGMDLLMTGSPAVDGYRRSLACASDAVAARLTALSSFYQYALSANLIESNPVGLISRPKVDA